MIDFDFFIVVEIIAGLCYSFHAIYRPVFAAELQASKTLIGFINKTKYHLLFFFFLVF